VRLPERLHRRLAREVEFYLLTQAGSLTTARAHGAALERGLVAAEAALGDLGTALAAAWTHARVGPTTTVGRALVRDPGAADILARHGLATCGDCPVRHDETLEELARGHQIPLDPLLLALNGARFPETP